MYLGYWRDVSMPIRIIPTNSIREILAYWLKCTCRCQSRVIPSPPPLGVDLLFIKIELQMASSTPRTTRTIVRGYVTYGTYYSTTRHIQKQLFRMETETIMAKKAAQQLLRFKGFISPRYTQVPDALFDELMAYLSGAELKVLLYIIRRTFGFKKDSDNISLSQICHGIKTREGEVLDNGTGLSLSTVQIAVKGLLEKNCVLSARNRSVKKGDEPTTYSLNMLPDTENRQGGIPKIGKGGYRKSVTQETDKQ